MFVISLQNCSFCILWSSIWGRNEIIETYIDPYRRWAFWGARALWFGIIQRWQTLFVFSSQHYRKKWCMCNIMQQHVRSIQERCQEIRWHSRRTEIQSLACSHKSWFDAASFQVKISCIPQVLRFLPPMFLWPCQRSSQLRAQWLGSFTWHQGSFTLPFRNHGPLPLEVRTPIALFIRGMIEKLQNDVNIRHHKTLNLFESQKAMASKWRGDICYRSWRLANHCSLETSDKGRYCRINRLGANNQNGGLLACRVQLHCMALGKTHNWGVLLRSRFAGMHSSGSLKRHLGRRRIQWEVFHGATGEHSFANEKFDRGIRTTHVHWSDLSLSTI